MYLLGFNKDPKRKNILTKFDLSKISAGDNVFIVGKSDNDQIIKNILEKNEKTINTIITPNSSLDAFYKPKLSDNFTLENVYNTSIIKNVIDYKKDSSASTLGDADSDSADDDDDLDSFIILDNCFKKITADDSNLTDLLDNGSMYNTITVVTVTNPASMLDVKSNIDYLCIMVNKHILFNQIIYDEYCKNVINRIDYDEIIDRYSMIIIDFKNTGNVYYL